MYIRHRLEEYHFLFFLKAQTGRRMSSPGAFSLDRLEPQFVIDVLLDQLGPKDQDRDQKYDKFHYTLPFINKNTIYLIKNQLHSLRSFDTQYPEAIY